MCKTVVEILGERVKGTQRIPQADLIISTQPRVLTRRPVNNVLIHTHHRRTGHSHTNPSRTKCHLARALVLCTPCKTLTTFLPPRSMPFPFLSRAPVFPTQSADLDRSAEGMLGERLRWGHSHAKSLRRRCVVWRGLSRRLGGGWGGCLGVNDGCCLRISDACCLGIPDEGCLWVSERGGAKERASKRWMTCSGIPVSLAICSSVGPSSMSGSGSRRRWTLLQGRSCGVSCWRPGMLVSCLRIEDQVPSHFGVCCDAFSAL